MQCTPSPDLYLLNLQSIRNIMEIRITIFLNNGDKEKLIGTRTLYYPITCSIQVDASYQILKLTILVNPFKLKLENLLSYLCCDFFYFYFLRKTTLELNGFSPKWASLDQIYKTVVQTYGLRPSYAQVSLCTPLILEEMAQELAQSQAFGIL